jgi:hypothetical protein
VLLLGERKRFPTQQDAFLGLVEKFLRIKPDLFTDPKTAPYVCSGRDGAVLFAPSAWQMNQPKRLVNGWFAETCLNNDQKVSILDNLAQYVGLKRHRDWDWQASNRPTKGFIDTDALFAELDNL